MARETLKSLTTRIFALEEQVDALDEVVESLEVVLTVIRTLGLDAAAAKVNKTKKRKKRKPQTTVQKKEFRLRMLRGQWDKATTAGDDERVEEIEEKIVIAEANLETAVNEAKAAEVAQATRDAIAADSPSEE